MEKIVKIQILSIVKYFTKEKFIIRRRSLHIRNRCATLGATSNFHRSPDGLIYRYDRIITASSRPMIPRGANLRNFPLCKKIISTKDYFVENFLVHIHPSNFPIVSINRN